MNDAIVDSMCPTEHDNYILLYLCFHIQRQPYYSLSLLSYTYPESTITLIWSWEHHLNCEVANIILQIFSFDIFVMQFVISTLACGRFSFNSQYRILDNDIFIGWANLQREITTISKRDRNVILSEIQISFQWSWQKYQPRCVCSRQTRLEYGEISKDFTCVSGCSVQVNSNVEHF